MSSLIKDRMFANNKCIEGVARGEVEKLWLKTHFYDQNKTVILITNVLIFLQLAFEIYEYVLLFIQRLR